MQTVTEVKLTIVKMYQTHYLLYDIYCNRILSKPAVRENLDFRLIFHVIIDIKEQKLEK